MRIHRRHVLTLGLTVAAGFTMDTITEGSAPCDKYRLTAYGGSRNSDAVRGPPFAAPFIALAERQQSAGPPSQCFSA